MTMMKTKRLRARGAVAPLLLLAVVLFACGGGKGDPPPPTPSNIRVVARDGDSFGGFKVGNIESANMSDDRTIAIIASEDSTPSFNGVFVRSPDGSVRSVLRRGDPLAEGLSFANVRNLSMSPTGEFAFEVGNELDNDGLFFWDGSRVSVLARTAPGETPEGFRILGGLRVAGGGLVVFTDGTSPCTIDETDPADPEISCDVRLFTARDGVVSRVEVPNALRDQRPTSVLLETNARGEVAVGLSARGSEPLVGVIRDGTFEGLLTRRALIEGLGILTSARPRAISRTGAIALDGFLDVDQDGQRDEERVFLLENGFLTTVAVGGGIFQGNPEVDIRAEGIDDQNQVVYRVDFESAAAGTNLRSIRAWKDGRITQIAHEGMPFGEDRKGNPQRILDIEQLRVVPNGDVVFVARLGNIDPKTGDRRISGVALVRWAGGSLGIQLELGARVPGGVLVRQISIADINANGDILLISSLDRDRDRALLLLPR